MKKVTVIGAGNGGVTAAYHFARQGYDVCLYDLQAFDTQLQAIKKNGGIRALDEAHGCQMILGGFAQAITPTTDAKEAAAFSHTLVMICPSFAQEPLFNELLPHLSPNQVIILMPGNYGGLVLSHLAKQTRPELDLTFVDAISIPWATRLEQEGVITIMGLKTFLPLSIYPKRKADDELIERLTELMPIPIEILDNPLVAGLENINFGGHPLLTTLNMGLLENFNGKFAYYRDCCSPATANACAVMDKERLAVGQRLGFSLRTELEAMNALYASDYQSVYEFNRESSTHIKINQAPASSASRYISEDVPYLLVPCYELACLAEIKVPIITSCIHISGAYNQENYFDSGRTLAKMGLAGLTLEQIKVLPDFCHTKSAK